MTKKFKEIIFAMSHEDVDAQIIDNSNLNLKTLKKPCEVVKSRPTKEKAYDISHNSTGEAIVFNQVQFNSGLTTRHGSGQDVLALKKVLTALGFKFTSYNDLTVQGIKDNLKEGITKFDFF